MKKAIITVLTAFSVLAFANESSVAKTLPNISLDRTKDGNSSFNKQGFSYVRLNAADSDRKAPFQVFPGLGVGYRLMIGNGALDISAHFSSNQGYEYEIGKDEGEKTDRYFWTLPKLSYVHYATASKETSAYGGLGLAWGGLEAGTDKHFDGILANANVGVEFFRTSAFRTFAELNVSQPAIPRSVSATFPGPIAELSIGAGF